MRTRNGGACAGAAGSARCWRGPGRRGAPPSGPRARAADPQSMPHTRLRRGRPRDPTGVQARRTARRRRDRANSSRSGRPRSRPGASGPTARGGDRDRSRRGDRGDGGPREVFQRACANATGPPGDAESAERPELDSFGLVHRRAGLCFARAESGADGREDSPHRAPARRATVIGVDTHDTVTHESPMSDRLRRPCALSPPAPVGAHVTIHTRRMTKRMHAL